MKRRFESFYRDHTFIKHNHKEVVYVTAKRNELLDCFKNFCNSKHLDCTHYSGILSPDDTTLFTTSGMQKRKKQYSDPLTNKTTVCDTQHCFRVNDLEEIGDSTHYLDFYMLGLFSFRHWSLKESVDFWFEFLSLVNVMPDTVTIHPLMQHHRVLYKDKNVKIIEDENCVWSDGDIGGYCTEFYRCGVELGNIVNPHGDCIDSGFGLERIGFFIPGYNNDTVTKDSVLIRSIMVLIDEGITPSNTKHGYVLRKLIRTSIRSSISLPEHPIIINEIEKYQKILDKIPQVIKKYPNRSHEYYFDTFGIDRDLIDTVRNNMK